MQGADLEFDDVAPNFRVQVHVIPFKAYSAGNSLVADLEIVDLDNGDGPAQGAGVGVDSDRQRFVEGLAENAVRHTEGDQLGGGGRERACQQQGQNKQDADGRSNHGKTPCGGFGVRRR